MPLYPPAATSGTVPPLGLGPTSLGLLAWNYDIMNINGPAGMGASGSMFLAEVPWPSTQTVTNVVLSIGAAGGTLTTGQCLCGIYSSGGSLLATSVDQSSAWLGTGFLPAALTSPTSIAAGTGTNPCVYAAYLWVGSSQPQVNKALGSATISNGANSAATLRFARGASGVTALPASITMSSNIVSTAAAHWVGLS